MYLQGFNPYEVLEAFRRTQKKNRDKKKEESILEKEMFDFIERMATATINEAIDDIFESWK